MPYQTFKSFKATQIYNQKKAKIIDAMRLTGSIVAIWNIDKEF